MLLKKLQKKVEQLKNKHPHKKIEIWSEDEGRVGLQPIVRKVWAPIGERPIAFNRTRYQWVYAYGFVRPKDGENICWLMPFVNNGVMSTVLEEFAKDRQLQKNDTLIILLIDQAGFHMSSEVRVPGNIILFPLPPYTPELQPVESLWPLLKEAVANRSFTDLDALEKTLINRARWLMDHPEIVKGAVGFEWINNIIKQYDSS